MQKPLFIGTLLSVFFFSSLHLALALTSQQTADALSLTELAETYSTAQISSLTQQPDTDKYDALMVTIGALTPMDLKTLRQTATNFRRLLMRSRAKPAISVMFRIKTLSRACLPHGKPPSSRMTQRH